MQIFNGPKKINCWLPAVIGAAGAIAGGLLAGKQSESAQETAWENSRAGSLEAFEREQSAYRTRYQTTMNDMRRAGLNPVLAAHGGFNVGTGVQGFNPQSFMAKTPDYTNLGASAKDVSTALTEESKTKVNVEKVKETIAKTAELRASKGLLNKQEALITEQAAKLVSEINVNEMRIRSMQVDIDKTQQATRLLKNQIRELQYLMVRLKKESEMYGSSAGTVMTWTNGILRSLGISTNIIAPLKGLGGK